MKLKIICLAGASLFYAPVLSQTSKQPLIRSNPSRNLCPCEDVETVEDFNVTEFASAPWYVQKQRVVPFQPPSTFYCVEANYNFEPNRWYSFLYGWELQARNYGETEDGETREATLCVKQQDENPSKLWVAPCWLPFSGPFWVVEYVEGEQGYAVISGGQPNVPTENGCKVEDGNGLWIFTRERNPSDILVEEVLNITSAKGFDVELEDFLTVNQTDCKRDLN